MDYTKILFVGLVLALVFFTFGLGSFVNFYNVQCSDGGNKILSCGSSNPSQPDVDVSDPYYTFGFGNLYTLNKDFLNSFGEVLKEDPLVNKLLTENSVCSQSGYTYYFKGYANPTNNPYSVSPINAVVSDNRDRSPCYSYTYMVNVGTIENNLLGTQYLEVEGDVIGNVNAQSQFTKGHFKTYGICDLKTSTCNVSLKEIDVSGLQQPFIRPTKMTIYLALGSVSMEEARIKSGVVAVAPVVETTPSVVQPTIADVTSPEYITQSSQQVVSQVKSTSISLWDSIVNFFRNLFGGFQ